MKQPLVCFVFLLLTLAGKAAVDSSRLRISLLTCSPGSDLYAVFGHSALRIVDSAAGTDIVYNYGTFNFDDPDFYTKFVRGRLRYYLSQENFSDFKNAYQYFQRGITEQVFALTVEERKQVQLFLFDNLRKENRSYAYDFFYDNCTTRLRDIIFKSKSVQAYDPPPLYEGNKTFRSHLHGYLNRAEMQWTKLGIDLLLGTVADKKMTISESMFLPDHLADGIRKAERTGLFILGEEIQVLKDTQPPAVPLPFWQRPLFFFLLIALLTLLPLFPGFSLNGSYTLNVDRVLFMSTGLLGVLLLFMWFGTDHASYRNNINLLWALPLNLVTGFLLPTSNRWQAFYFRLYSLLLLMLFVLIMIMPGIVNQSLTPLIAVLSYRSWINGQKNKKA